MKIQFHRRKQWDIGQGRENDIVPIVACHVYSGNTSRRIFVLWRNGFRGFGIEIRWTTY